MKVKVLVADKFPEHYIKQMKDLNLDVDYSPKLGENDLPEAIKNTDILVVRSTKVNSQTITNGKNLNLIIRAGAGVNNIDIKAAIAAKASTAGLTKEAVNALLAASV